MTTSTLDSVTDSKWRVGEMQSDSSAPVSQSSSSSHRHESGMHGDEGVWAAGALQSNSQRGLQGDVELAAR